MCINYVFENNLYATIFEFISCILCLFFNVVDASSSWYQQMVKTMCFPVDGKIED
jgi:hypothetical protein